MNYHNSELIEHLAAEFVLGTLRGRARDRFERLQMESLKVRQTVWEWQQRLIPMAEAIEDESPPAWLWHKIKRRTVTQEQAKANTGLWESLIVWRSVGAMASVAALVLCLLLVGKHPQSGLTEPENYFAVFNNEKAQPLWLISSDLSSGRLSIRAVNAKAAAIDKAFELWMLPGDGSAPRSLGVMPVNGEKQAYTIASPSLEILRTASSLAVSVEPTGGSPTGVPTGPVVYQTSLIDL